MTILDVQCIHCRRLRPQSEMKLANLPGLPMMCRRGFACYLIGIRLRFRDPWHWRNAGTFDRRF